MFEAFRRQTVVNFSTRPNTLSASKRNGIEQGILRDQTFNKLILVLPQQLAQKS